MEFLSQLGSMKKAYLWAIAVIILILLTEMTVLIIDIILKGQITANCLFICLIANSFVAIFAIGLAGFFLKYLVELQRDNSYVSEVMAKLDQITCALAKNDEAYRNILATSLDGFWLVSADGLLLDVNQRYCELSGYSREELLKMSIIDLEAKETVEENAVHIQHVITHGGDQFETIHRRKDGSFWHIEVSTIYSEAKGGLLYAFLRDISDRKQAEKELRESQELLQAITDNTNTVIFIKDLSDRIVFINKQFETLFHVDSKTICGKTTYDVFPKELADKFIDDDREVIQAGHPITMEETVPQSDGEHFYITVKFPLRDIEGEIYAVCGIATDITELKRAEIALQEQQEMLRALADNSNAMIFIKDTDLNYVFVNSLFEKEFQVCNAQIAGKNDYDVFPQEFADKFTANDKLVIRTGVPFSIEEAAPHKDGVHTYLSVKFPLRKNSGEIYGVCGIATDITERKKLELEKEQYFTFFQLARDLQCIANRDGLFTKINPAFSKVLGYSETELLKTPYLDFVHPEDRQATVSLVSKQLTDGNVILDFENRYLCKNGLYRWLSWKAVANPNDHLIYATARDVTRLKRQQEQIRLLSESELNKAKLEAERANQAKSDFLSSMSHELFTPMNAVLGFAQLLEIEDLTKDQSEYVSSILTSGYKLLDLIKEVLDFSLVESEQLELKLKKLDLVKLVQECIGLMQSFAVKKGIHINHAICEACHAPIMADSLRLKQVILNLLSNAIKYNHENGSVTISCESEPQYVKISIADTGQGLSDEQMEKLFLPFERLSAKNSAIEGAGLGLCISKKLIQAMGGRIGVNSTLGEGSCFWIEIPRL